MKTLRILKWDNDSPLENVSGWPIKGFEIRLSECTNLRGTDLKRTLRKISQKKIMEINICRADKILSLTDYFEYYGAVVEVIDGA